MLDLTQGHEAKVLIRFALPMLLGNVFQQLYNTVDSVVVGHFVSKQALAAVGQAFPVMFISAALMMGFGIASNVLVAQFFGAKKFDQVKKIIDTTISVTMIFALFMTVVGYFFAPFILNLMQTPADVMPDATLYLRIIFLGSLPSFGYNAVSSIQRGLGDSRTPLYALIISTVVNIILDLVFVLVFHWGIAGVAIATIIAQIAALAWTIAYLKRHQEKNFIDFKALSFDRAVFKDILKIGLPSGVQQAMVGAGIMALTGVVNMFGTDTAAAFSAAGKLDGFAMMPAMSVGMAISTFSGQNFGAGKLDRISRGLYYGIAITVGVIGSVSVLLFFFGDYFVRWFTTEPAVIKIGFEYVRIVSLGYVLHAVMFTYAGVIRGAGSVMFPMISTLMAMWIVRIPLAFILSKHWGTAGIWWSIVIGFGSGMIANMLYYYFGNWKKRLHLFAKP